MRPAPRSTRVRRPTLLRLPEDDLADGKAHLGGRADGREVFRGAFDKATPRKGGAFRVIDGKKCDNTPEDEARHDVTDELSAYKLAQLPAPGVFGVFYESDRPTKNALEKKWIDSTREKLGNPSDHALLQKTFDRMQ